MIAIVRRSKVVSEGQNPRDIQFAGFAKLLAEECAQLPVDLKEPVEDANRRFQLLIAQRAYDLVSSAAHFMLGGAPLPPDRDEAFIRHVVQIVPDMTGWPKEYNDRTK
jgi:hypothetical protein